MTLSNITDRGTLRGVIYRGAGSGTTDYTMLSNKPQINGHTLQGDQSGDNLDLIDKGSLKINEHTLEGSMTGDDLGLINNVDLKFNVGYAGNILHNIKYKNDTYTAYAAPFSGASSGQNGTMGLVPAPLSSQGDYDKFLKGNGHWASPISNFSLSEINTGAKWIDGKYIYRKVFGDGTTHQDNIDVSSLNIEILIKCEGLGCDNNSMYDISSPVWCESNVSGINQRSMYIDGSNHLRYTKQTSGYNVYYIIIEYTKTS